jgi:hypothetical protein
MRAQTVQTWIARHLLVRRRLTNVCTSYLLFLMVVTRKHSLEEAARFSGRHKSQFSKMLKAQSQGRSLYPGKPLQETSPARS